MMTRRDHRTFAEKLRTFPTTAKRETVAKMIADVCEKDNPAFNRERFLEACGLKEEA